MCIINKDLIKDDLYLAVNGKWLESAIIPEDKPTTGGFSDLVEEIEQKLKDYLKDKILTDKSYNSHY